MILFFQYYMSYLILELSYNYPFFGFVDKPYLPYDHLVLWYQTMLPFY
jgi:hypothetical protein